LSDLWLRRNFPLPAAIYRRTYELQSDIMPMNHRSLRSCLGAFAPIIWIFLCFRVSAAPPAGILDETHAAVQAVMAVQADVTPALLLKPEILGTAVELDGAGNIALAIYVDRAAAGVGEVVAGLPKEIRGVGVRPRLMDQIEAMGYYTGKQPPPISLGTSGGWAYDDANGYCCGGTLGSLVWISGVQYILSNAHVLEGDTAYGKNYRVAQTGDPVVQPGLIDVDCYRSRTQTVGTLWRRNSLSNSNVDCAVARVRSGMVRTDGAILGIGTISHSPIAAAINQRVKKSGRSTALTHSHISGLNATVKVNYTYECHGSTYYKTFYGQIVIYNPSSQFLRNGDSGSLLVQDVTTNPRPIGLLFAGNTSVAFANPINAVLNFLRATMVGK
jgi:hypothetical protein